MNDGAPPGEFAAEPLSGLVLVVEDDPSTRYLVTRTLQAAGFRTTEADNGLAALALARELPDVIVLDVLLPDMDGYTVCRRLKSDPLTRAVPVLQVSAAFKEDADRAIGLDAGADAYLVHPYGPLELVATIRTLMRARRAADEATQLREHLEKLVEERTTELAVKVLELAEQKEQLAARTAELQVSADSLSASNAELETFVYTASHDLRTPLVALCGMADLLPDAVERGDKQEAQYVVERIVSNAERMTRMLDDLLSYSRAGRSAGDGTPLDLGPVVAGVLDDLRGRLRGPGTLVEVPDDWPRVLADKGEVYQVLANLVTNALKFAGGAGRAKHLRLAWARDGKMVRITVEDNGPGVPEHYREKVFDLFQRLDPAAEGTGVGLAIVKRIIERHGGRAWIEDSSLGGATLAVTLPAAA